jgi:hypothetical protein
MMPLLLKVVRRRFGASMVVQRTNDKAPAKPGLSRHSLRQEGEADQAVLMLTVWRFWGPLVAKSTTPSTSANNV